MKGEVYVPPSYSYVTKITSATELAEQGKITIKGDNLENNVNAMMSYILLTTDGNSKNKVPVIDVENLGNKFFMNTFLKCKDIKSKKDVERSIYINNVPTGRYKMLGGGQTGYKGLIPGIISNLESFNPFDAIKELIGSSTPDCVEVKLETIDNSNVASKDKGYIAIKDLMDMKDMDMHLKRDDSEPQYNDACIKNWNNKDPTCDIKFQKEENFLNRIFSSKSNNRYDDNENSIFKSSESEFIEQTPISQLYYSGISILLIFMIYRMVYKSK